MKSNTEAIEVILEGITKAGYEPGRDIFLGIDAAASEFYENGKYVLKAETNIRRISAEASLIKYQLLYHVLYLIDS